MNRANYSKAIAVGLIVFLPSLYISGSTKEQNEERLQDRALALMDSQFLLSGWWMSRLRCRIGSNRWWIPCSTSDVQASILWLANKIPVVNRFLIAEYTGATGVGQRKGTDRVLKSTTREVGGKSIIVQINLARIHCIFLAVRHVHFYKAILSIL